MNKFGSEHIQKMYNGEKVVCKDTRQPVFEAFKTYHDVLGEGFAIVTFEGLINYPSAENAVARGEQDLDYFFYKNNESVLEKMNEIYEENFA
jgi:hypothetical protein